MKESRFPARGNTPHNRQEASTRGRSPPASAFGGWVTASRLKQTTPALNGMSVNGHVGGTSASPQGSPLRISLRLEGGRPRVACQISPLSASSQWQPFLQAQ